MLRVARLLRSSPELFILIKAIVSASRATFFALSLLFVILYCYSVLFVQMLKGSYSGDLYFKNIASSLQNLFLHVALADEISLMFKDVANDSLIATAALLSVILIATITVMNMLIGVLVEAISAIAESERMAMQISIVESTLLSIFDEDLDADQDALISKDELVKVVDSKAAVTALEDLGIDVIGLVESADHIFEDNFRGVTEEGQNAEENFGRMLTFGEFMDVLLQLRGSNKATVRDIVDVKKYVNKVLKNVDKLRVEMSISQAEIEQLQETARASLAIAHNTASSVENERETKRAVFTPVHL